MLDDSNNNHYQFNTDYNSILLIDILLRVKTLILSILIRILTIFLIRLTLPLFIQVIIKFQDILILIMTISSLII